MRVQTRQGIVDFKGRAVVLAAGRFEANPEMRARYLGAGWDLVKVRGSRYNTGEVLNFALGSGAQLAQRGLTGPPTIIEGKRGFLKVFADQVEPEEITRDLGREFKIMRIWFKLYPCVATVQGVIYTLAKLIEKHRSTQKTPRQSPIRCNSRAIGVRAKSRRNKRTGMAG